MGKGTILVYNPVMVLYMDALAFNSILCSGGTAPTDAGLNTLRKMATGIPENFYSGKDTKNKEKIKNLINWININYLYNNIIASNSITDLINVSSGILTNDKITPEMAERQFTNFCKGLKAGIIANLIGYGCTPFPIILNQIPSEYRYLNFPYGNGTFENVFWQTTGGNEYVVWPFFLGINHNTAQEMPNGWNSVADGDYADFMIGCRYGAARTASSASPSSMIQCFYWSYMRNQGGSTAYGNLSYSGTDVEMQMQFLYDHMLPEYLKKNILTTRKYFANPANTRLYGDYKCWIPSAKELGQTMTATNGYGIPTNENNYTQKYFCFPAMSGNASNNSMRVQSFGNAWTYMWTRTVDPLSNFDQQSYTVFLIVGDSLGVGTTTTRIAIMGLPPASEFSGVVYNRQSRRNEHVPYTIKRKCRRYVGTYIQKTHSENRISQNHAGTTQRNNKSNSLHNEHRSILHIYADTGRIKPEYDHERRQNDAA